MLCVTVRSSTCRISTQCPVCSLTVDTSTFQHILKQYGCISHVEAAVIAAWQLLGYIQELSLTGRVLSSTLEFKGEAGCTQLVEISWSDKLLRSYRKTLQITWCPCVLSLDTGQGHIVKLLVKQFVILMMQSGARLFGILTLLSATF